MENSFEDELKKMEGLSLEEKLKRGREYFAQKDLYPIPSFEAKDAKGDALFIGDSVRYSVAGRENYIQKRHVLPPPFEDEKQKEEFEQRIIEQAKVFRGKVNRIDEARVIWVTPEDALDWHPQDQWGVAIPMKSEWIIKE
jgi:hypothetical protein